MQKRHLLGVSLGTLLKPKPQEESEHLFFVLGS